MARKRKEKGKDDVPSIQLRQPDRSLPTDKTLLQIVEDRQLFQQADERQNQQKKQKQQTAGQVLGEREDVRGGKKRAGEDGEEDEDEDGDARLPPRVERVMDTVLWSASLAMLHFTLDVLVQNQYAVAIHWPGVAVRAVQAFFGECPLVLMTSTSKIPTYILHHPRPSHGPIT